LIGLEHVRPDAVASHRHCRLGKWYFDEETQKWLKGIVAFERLDVPHQAVHAAAKKAAEAYERGDIRQAEIHLHELEIASTEVVGHINELIEKIERDRTFMNV